MDPVQVVQEFIDAFNTRDVDRVVGYFSADAVMQDDAGNVFAQGEDGGKAAAMALFSMLPSARMPVQDYLMWSVIDHREVRQKILKKLVTRPVWLAHRRLTPDVGASLDDFGQRGELSRR